MVSNTQLLEVVDAIKSQYTVTGVTPYYYTGGTMNAVNNVTYLGRLLCMPASTFEVSFCAPFDSTQNRQSLSIEFLRSGSPFIASSLYSESGFIFCGYRLSTPQFQLPPTVVIAVDTDQNYPPGTVYYIQFSSPSRVTGRYRVNGVIPKVGDSFNSSWVFVSY